MASMKTTASIARRLQSHYYGQLPRICRPIRCCYATKPDANEDDRPIRFTNSDASKLSFEEVYTYVGSQHLTPSYQPLVVVCSVAVFLIYFCILREENDVDAKFSLTLYDHIEGLEEVQLRASLLYNKEHNLDTTAIEKRLQEIEAGKNQ